MALVCEGGSRRAADVLVDVVGSRSAADLLICDVASRSAAGWQRNDTLMDKL